MPIRDESHITDIGEEREQALVETSDEEFDRMAFAQRALDLVCPPRTRVAICEGIFRVRVDSGKNWRGGAGARWAVLSVPPRASRRAIALAALELAAGAGPAAPWAIDVLMADEGAVTAA